MIQAILTNTMPMHKMYGKQYGIKTIIQHHYLYLKSEVIILTVAFENLTDVCMENHQLDPACLGGSSEGD